MFDFGNMRLARKLPLTIALPSILIVSLLGVFQLTQEGKAIENDHRVSYSSYIKEKSTTIERWLLDASVEVVALGDSYAIHTALQEFSSAWRVHGPGVSDEMRRLYITDNPNPTGQKDELIAATDISEWSSVHAVHHVGLRSFQRARGYYDLFLFDLNGNLVYSVFKEDDFALNFNTGVYAETGLGEAFQAANALAAGAFHMTDIEPYAPSADAPAMFMSTPVFINGRKAGVVAVQLPLDVMARTLSASELLGASGETYIVDNNGKALSPSRHEGGFATLDVLPQTPPITAVLVGENTFFADTRGVNGAQVTAVTQGVTTPRGDTWGMVFEINRAEAMAAFRKSVATAIVGLVLSMAVLCVLAWWSARRVTGRIDVLAREMETIAAEDYSQQIVGQDRKDEVGFISKTLANLQVRLREGAEAQAREKSVQENNVRVVTLISAALKDLAKGDFRNLVEEHFPEEHKQLRYSINDAMVSLNEVILTVRDTADSINQGVEEIASSADELAQRTESQAANLEQTAAALEQVTASVNLASENAQGVKKTVGMARDHAKSSGQVVDETIAAMTEIETSSSQISQVISLIDDIAFQTNLLALNAGVEAARAGEAGRGFAVVASEVRALAQRSADAAKEIKVLIAESGQQVERGVEMVGRTGIALQTIVDQVQDIDRLVQQIAQSSREQAIALSEINNGMANVDKVTQSNAAMVEENTAASHLLRSDANKLIEHVGQFKTRPLAVMAARNGAQDGAYVEITSERLNSPALPTEDGVSIAANSRWGRL